MKITDEAREAVKQDKLKPKTKMSAKAVAYFQSKTEMDELEKKNRELFISQFSQLWKDFHSLKEVIKRCVKDAPIISVSVIEGKRFNGKLTDGQWKEMLSKRAHKLMHSLSHNWTPTSIGQLLFLSELSPDEALMSEEKLLHKLEETWGEYRLNPVKRTVKAKQAVECKYCDLKAKCMFAKHKKPAPCKDERDKFCSKACRGRALYYAKHQVTIPAMVEGDSGEKNRAV